jgi:hypothetical protein
MAIATQLTTGKVRFSYCHLFKPVKPKGSDTEKYSVTLLIPKKDTRTREKINAAIEAARALYAEKGGKGAERLKTTLRDGDGEKPDGGPYGPECKGCILLPSSSLRAPTLVYADKTPLTAPQELWSGCYGRAVLNFYAYEANGNRGITAGLNGVMKLHDGEPLTAGVVTDADWDSDYDDFDTASSDTYGRTNLEDMLN